jgi:hypothetical protein
MTPDDLNVSRETLDKLQAFADLVQKWTSKINLISKPSVPEVWDRHILDSAQLYDLATLAVAGVFRVLLFVSLHRGRAQIRRLPWLKAISGNRPFCGPQSESCLWMPGC